MRFAKRLDLSIPCVCDCLFSNTFNHYPAPVLRNFLHNIWHSFPVQLLILNFRNNVILTLMWILLWLFSFGFIGQYFGIHLLFVEPEYLGTVGYRSFFILGFAFGLFTISWHLTIYLINAKYFPFLAAMERPFVKFSINNSIIPLFFLISFLIHIGIFYANNEYSGIIMNIKYIGGFLAGNLLMVLLTSMYFQFTNRDISYFKKLLPQLVVALSADKKDKDYQTLSRYHGKWPVETYLSETFRPKLVRGVDHYEKEILMRIFRQNHLNAFVFQAVAILILLLIGWKIEFKYFRIPAGASIYLVFSIFIFLIGIFTYWFEAWRLTMLILFLVAFNYVTGFRFIDFKNKALGLDYTKEKVPYTYTHFQSLIDLESTEKDKAVFYKILNNWKAKNTTENSEKKPKMIFIASSGGGLRAALWATTVITHIDSVSQNEVFNKTALIAGASGGIIGLAYYRELQLQKKLGNQSVSNKECLYSISDDLLNAVAINIISKDILNPMSKFTLDGKEYTNDRGVAFEKQLNENTGYLLDKRLKAYRAPEFSAEIPLMIITPSIVNDGRRLLISPHRLSFMMVAPIGITNTDAVQIDGLDFQCLFSEHGADSLLFTTALRMNATYPYILPNVTLPTIPEVEVMDAGFRDNYGLMTITRFIHVFKDWIKENTSGVLIIQITDKAKIDDIYGTEHDGLLSGLINPLGIPGQVISLQDYEFDTNLGFLYDLLGNQLEIVRFIYNPADKKNDVSMSFHLTEKEKRIVMQQIFTEDNKKATARLMQLLK